MDNTKETLSLINMDDGQSGKIIAVNGGRMLTKRLADLGLLKGTLIVVLRRTLFSGPVQVEVCGSRLVLGRGLASKIMVELQ